MVVRAASTVGRLIRARLLEVAREPAVFWVFFFPIGMALALGFAFRDRAPEPVAVGITGRAETSAVRESLTRSSLLKPQVFATVEEGRAALRTGKIALLVENGSPVVYWYDATRPDSRLARFEVNEALQAAAGRSDRCPSAIRSCRKRDRATSTSSSPGFGLNLLSTSVWDRVFDRQRPPQEDPEADDGDADAPLRYLLAQMFSASSCSPSRRSSSWCSGSSSSRSRSGSVLGSWRSTICSFPSPDWASSAGRASRRSRASTG
jgi:hypothetical protein